MSKVLMVASEATPFAKTGGLADVIGSLAPALRARGDEAAIVMPRYRGVSLRNAERLQDGLPLEFGGVTHGVSLYRVEHEGIPYFFVDCPPLFHRDGLYGDGAGDYPDNHVRFAVLCQAALAVARSHFHPEILHCHDWQAALMPIYLRQPRYAGPELAAVKTLFTIHNLGYQGLFPPEALPEMGLDASLLHMDGLEFFGKINLLKGGVIFSDAISTVSRAYAAEIQSPELGFGLDGLLRSRGGSLTGILNGADYTQWDPAIDPRIAARYTAQNLAGKTQCKRDLLAEFGLDAENIGKPLVGIVSRFAEQKGFDLIEEITPELAAEPLCLVALGTGDARYEQMFQRLAAAWPAKIAVRIAYDDRLAHKIEAGADIFLMPSRYEPCGLNQIYSLRYGTVPVVRATGGLDDTIDESTGFKFREYTGAALLGSLREALAAFRDRDAWRARMRRGMARDFSWNASAAEYSALYRHLRG